MNIKELTDIKTTINWLLDNGEFKDIETAYNIAMNSVDILKEALTIPIVIESFKVISIELSDYTQITVVNEETNTVVCHMYTMDGVNIDNVKKQAQKIADALNVL